MDRVREPSNQTKNYGEQLQIAAITKKGNLFHPGPVSLTVGSPVLAWDKGES